MAPVSRARRHFLLTIGAGGAGAAIAATGGAKASAAPAAAKRKRPGYHASAHIGKYYRTAKI